MIVRSLRHAVAAAVLFAGGLAAHAADTYKIDPVHSSVVFRISHLNTGMIYGRFNQIEGSFTVDNDDATKSKIEGTIPTASIDTANAKRDEHLKSPDFFNANQFPEITFQSTSVKPSEKGLTVTGDLSIHGVAKSVKIEMTKGPEAEMRGQKRVGLHGEVTIKRSDFQMGGFTEALGDEVHIFLGIEGIKQ